MGVGGVSRLAASLADVLLPMLHVLLVPCVAGLTPLPHGGLVVCVVDLLLLLLLALTALRGLGVLLGLLLALLQAMGGERLWSAGVGKRVN